ncbi:MAG: hypothetical protein B7Z59_10375, partial [Acidiphilium sp. 37-67-22]
MRYRSCLGVRYGFCRVARSRGNRPEALRANDHWQRLRGDAAGRTVMDAATGKIISENNAYNIRYPASLTKLMTLDLAFTALKDGRLRMNTALPVSAAAASVQPVKLDLVAGQTVTVRQAMLGMTTLSANDAATALGQYLGNGSIRRAAAEMTAHAHAIGMQRSVFRNPSGLPDPNQVTDAYDMAILARHLLLDYPQYRYLFSVPSF